MLNCLSEGINVNENNDLCECPVCHYRYFFDGNFILKHASLMAVIKLIQKSYRLQ